MQSDENKMSRSSRNRRDELVKALFLLKAKARRRTQAYSCFLDEQPSGLVPRRVRPSPNPSADYVDLIVNSRFRYQPGSDPPEEIQQRGLPLDCFLRGYPIAWIEDSGIGIWTPFWARGEWAEALPALRPGLTVPSGLRPAVLRTLAMADILVARDHEQARTAEWQGIFQAAQARYQANGYVVVRDLIHPLHLGAMRHYYRSLIEDGGLPLGDSQVAERYRIHSEILASFFHPQLANLVGRIAGEPVKPSYVYFASYLPGAALPRHTDREQCEFSISLLADYAPDPDGPSGWPLYMENPAAPEVVHAADLGIGDAVVYRGRELVHYRKPLPEGHRSTSLFLHYVRENYAGDVT